MIVLLYENTPAYGCSRRPVNDLDEGALLSAGGGLCGRQVSAEAAFERLAIERRMLVGSCRAGNQSARAAS